MKAKLSNASQWILTAIISLLGFSGCSKEEEIPLMHGSPTVDYKAEGCITDEAGNPIEGIYYTQIPKSAYIIVNSDRC